MQKLKTAYFWKIIIGYTLIFLIVRLAIELLIAENILEPRRMFGIIFTATVFGLFMGFMSKPTAVKNNDIKELV